VAVIKQFPPRDITELDVQRHHFRQRGQAPATVPWPDFLPPAVMKSWP